MLAWLFTHRPPMPQSNAAAQPARSQPGTNPIQLQGWAGPSVRWRPANRWSSTPNSTPSFFWAARPAAGRSPAPPTEGIRLHLMPTLEARGCCNATTPQKQGISSIERLRTAHDLAHTARSTEEPRFPAMPSHLSSSTAPNHSIKRTATGKPASAAYVKR